jgi:hypothetical protein
MIRRKFMGAKGIGYPGAIQVFYDRRSQAPRAFFFFAVNVPPTIRTTIATTGPWSLRRVVE